MKYVVKVDDFELSEDEYMAVQDNELSLFDVLDNRFTNDRLNIYIKDFSRPVRLVSQCLLYCRLVGFIMAV